MANHQTITYNNHAALIWGSVWQTSHRFPDIPEGEILSEAHQIFCRCYKKWKAEKQVKFSTYLTASLKACFSNCGWYQKPLPKYLDPEEVGVNGACSPERLVLLKEALGQMGPLAVEVVNCVFSPPPLLRRTMREEKAPLPSRKALRKYLRRDEGIGDATAITEAFDEISRTLEEV